MKQYVQSGISENTKGPGTQASISPVSDYWTNWPSVEVLAFVKDVQNVKISNLEPKKCVFLLMFYDVTFHPETVSTILTFTT